MTRTPDRVDPNGFAVALYGQLRRRSGNLFFSPFSIRAALGMAYAGARGQTAAQMSEALRLPSSSEEAQAKLAESHHQLGAAGGQCELSIAHSLWSQEGASLQPAFRDLMARHYGGGMHLANFRRDAEVARSNINQWVEGKTGRRIQALIPPGSLNSDTRLVLANAIFFKGIWEHRFATSKTCDAPFWLEDGRSVEVPTMRQRCEVAYARGEGYQGVRMDYRGGDLSMLVLLPDERKGFGRLENSLSLETLRCFAEKHHVIEIEVLLPRFRIEWGTVNLRDSLGGLGMTFPFDRSRADFSGINGFTPPHEEALHLSAVFHKAFVEVDEEGTRAAAATAASMLTMGGGYRDLVFRADHPFIFAILDRRSGAILFLGRVSDPTKERE